MNFPKDAFNDFLTTFPLLCFPCSPNWDALSQPLPPTSDDTVHLLMRPASASLLQCCIVVKSQASRV